MIRVETRDGKKWIVFIDPATGEAVEEVHAGSVGIVFAEEIARLNAVISEKDNEIERCKQLDCVQRSIISELRSLSYDQVDASTVGDAPSVNVRDDVKACRHLLSKISRLLTLEILSAAACHYSEPIAKRCPETQSEIVERLARDGLDVTNGGPITE